MDWQELEKRIRRQAEAIWQAKASPETVNGVKVDCVVKRAVDNWVLVEISKSNTLGKLRIDLAKFAVVRPYLISKDIYPQCFFVCLDPPPSLFETGAGNNIRVMSAKDFANLFFDFNKYEFERRKKAFGSAVDPLSGEPDVSHYTPVAFRYGATARPVSLEEIARKVGNKKRVILVGEYGTGKSRCVQEIFDALAKSLDGAPVYPISIDLKLSWGLQTAEELLRRHFVDLGLTSIGEQVLRIYTQESICFLLDGFDEVASQAWGSDAAKLRQLRRGSLSAVRDLISKVRGGLLICGRSHYFNSDEEMFDALGLQSSEAEIIESPEEFTIQEIHDFLKSRGIHRPIPDWLPRRPLICQTMISYGEPTALDASATWSDRARFWHHLIDVIAVRESKIHPILDPQTIKRVLIRLSRDTRTKSSNVGPITIEELNSAFHSVTHTFPVDESAAMLQRLPSLGRVRAESSDRQFVDIFILDGLRALDVVECIKERSDDVLHAEWVNPLRELGQDVLTAYLDDMDFQKVLSYARRSNDSGNAILASDIVSTLCLLDFPSVDLQGIVLSDAHIVFLDLSSDNVKRLTLRKSIIETLRLPTRPPEAILIAESIVNNVVGVSDVRGLPDWIKATHVENFERVDTVSAIKNTELSPAQKILVTMVKKIFFQRGGGRRESALLRGLGEIAPHSVADRILNKLMRDGLVEKFKGSQGWVYTPVRKHADRMARLVDQLTQSNDQLWLDISKM